jgi:DNA-binding CsgD family transcriptional regulator
VGGQARALRPFWSQEIATAIDSTPVEIIAAGRRGDVAGLFEAYDAGTAAVAAIWGTGFDARVRFAAVAVGQLASLLPSLPAAERVTVMDRIEAMERELGQTVGELEKQWGLEGLAWRMRLRAELLRARWVAGVGAPSQSELVAAWRDAEAAYDAFGHVYELAAVRVVLAGILRSTGDPAAAREPADLAREAARRLGARPLLDELEATTPPRPESDSLTPRETEILALVAEGRTNGEIGRRLYISTKTVSVHVSNILGKLGAAGRTEAAAIARRRGLLAD